MSNGNEGNTIYNSKCYRKLKALSDSKPNIEFYAVVNIWSIDEFEIYEGYENLPYINEEYYSLFEFYFVNGEEYNV